MSQKNLQILGVTSSTKPRTEWNGMERNERNEQNSRFSSPRWRNDNSTGICLLVLTDNKRTCMCLYPPSSAKWWQPKL